MGQERDAAGFEQHLLASGFKQVYVVGKDRVLLPLIDQGMREDRDRFLASVDNYYRAIIDLNRTVFSDSPEIAAQVYAADNKEYGDAARGLFEYYTDPGIIMELLSGRGFENITYRSDSRGIWCNIAARKRQVP